MTSIEQPGRFYLGREFDWRNRELEAGDDKILSYEAKDLTTHAVCVGMTGSGKTGLCLALLEEAALQGIPAIIVDPKGDLGNLLLAFPQLRSEDFRPWIDENEAQGKGMSPDEFAAKTAQAWRNGLEQWKQDGSRIQRYLDAVDLAIYTPASNAGLSLTVLRSFAAPSPMVLDDSDALRERIVSTVSGLLVLLDIDSDPVRSREHILFSKILENAWRKKQDLDLPGLIHAIQTPPFDKVGFADVESFYSANDRLALAMQLNNMLASPGFSAWMEGEPLDIGRLLYTAENKPRLSIISIAHLADAEKMFFLTVLLGELLAWVRSQPGTSSLRALFYMDEVFGYFPPTANPPTKTPMLTLLKQARAFGVGVVLATQNPVDLDYKGLSNAGTWFLGRLQTERDKMRVIEGLEGASAAVGAKFNRAVMEQMLSALGNRVFLMNNVHNDQPVVFQTRWCMSYLRGPLSRMDIQKLMSDRKQKVVRSDASGTAKPTASTGGARPLVPAEANECFVVPKKSLADKDRLVYRPALVGNARLHFLDAKCSIDTWQDVAMMTRLDGDIGEQPWTDAEVWEPEAITLERQPRDGAAIADLPAAAARGKSYSEWQKDLASYLYAEHPLKLWACEMVDEVSLPEESKQQFRIRLESKCNEQTAAEQGKSRDNFAKKLATVEGQIQRAQQKVEKEKGQRWQKIIGAILSFFTMFVSILIYKRKFVSRRNISAASAAARRAGSITSEQGDVQHAEENLDVLQQKKAD
ncbi:MAG: ATP-binding protein, partial [Pirellulales bacterium]|nr:ATP-binding protein [Pirellulales bacterium]